MWWPQVTRAEFYQWFDTPRYQGMAALAARALAYAQAQQVDRLGPLTGGQDWASGDSTTVTGQDGRLADCPGTGHAAALNKPTVLSVSCGAAGRNHCSPTCEPDSRPRTIDASWHGGGLLADCGYASLERLRACGPPEVRLVIRLQDHWSPKVAYTARGQGSREFCPETDFDALLAEEPRVLNSRAIDANGPVGSPQHPLHLRSGRGTRLRGCAGIAAKNPTGAVDHLPSISDQERMGQSVARKQANHDTLMAVASAGTYAWSPSALSDETG